ncbi:MAG TPA: hypothetical protein VGC30_04605, partial [Dokdonella sp.]
MGQADDKRSRARLVPSRAWLPDWRVLLSLACATLLLVAGAFFAWQSWLTLRAQSRIEAADNARTTAAAAVTARIRHDAERAQNALADPAVAQALADGGEQGRAAAEATLRRALPDLGAVEFFSADLDEVLSGDLSAIGYAKAAALMQAKVGGAQPRAQVGTDKQRGQQLMFALPVRVGDATRAYAVVELPFAPVLAAFRAAAATAGTRLDLRQGDGRGDLVLASAGTGGGNSLGDLGVAVAGSKLRVGRAEPEAFLVAPQSPALLVALTVVCLLGGGVALWLRQVGIQRTVAMLQ